MTRSKGFFTQDVVYRWIDAYGVAFDTKIKCPGDFATISDEQPQFERYGDCYHYKARLVPNEGGFIYDADGVSGSNGTHALRYHDLKSDYVEDGGFNARAFQAMKPEINGAVQAPLEIKELIGSWRDLLKPFKMKSSLISKAGSTNLWYQFGIAPTIGAIQDVTAALSAFDQRLNDFLRLQGQELTTHYREPTLVPFSESVVKQTTGDHWYKVTLKVAEHWEARSATMKYKYRIPGIEQMSKDLIKLKAYGDLFGASQIVGMLWEATPWSFIVDWFFSVGDFLEQFDKPFLDTEVEVIDYCVSFRSQHTDSIYMERAGGIIKAGVYDESYYQRIRCLPDYGYFGIRTSGNFGTRQFLLGLSLLVS